MRTAPLVPWRRFPFDCVGNQRGGATILQRENAHACYVQVHFLADNRILLDLG